MKKRLGVSIFSCVLLLSLSTLPAQAGYVTIVNNSDSSCYLRFIGYFLQSPTNMSTPCAKPGKKEWTHTSLSVGVIRTVCCTKDNCGGVQIKTGEYNVPGTWLPHRNFKVTVGGAGYDITVTEEAP